MRDHSTIIIEPGRTEKNYWKDLWKFRELFVILSWRDIQVRYRQTFIGASWSIIRPLLTTLIFTVVFNKVARLDAPANIPYPLLVLAGMLPWQFFSTALTEASNSLVANSNLISKIYFPRLIIPVSSIITSLVDLLVSFGLLLVAMAYYRFIPDARILLLPIFVFMALLAALGFGLFITALNVKYRDFRNIMPVLMQIGIYVTPIGFDSSIIPERWRLLFSCNPMVGIVEGFRWCLLGRPVNWTSVFLSMSIITVALIISITYFRKTEKSFADDI